MVPSLDSVSWMPEGDKVLVPGADLIELLEEDLMPYGDLWRFTVSGNLVAAEICGGLTLEETSCIVQRLYQLPEVTNVSVYTASNQTEPGKQAAVSLIITTALNEERRRGEMSLSSLLTRRGKVLLGILAVLLLVAM